METFTVQIYSGETFVFNRDKFKDYFPSCVITVALNDSESHLTLTEPTVTKEVMIFLEQMMRGSAELPSPPLQVALQKAERYLGTHILKGIHLWPEVKSLTRENLLEKYLPLLASAIDRNCLALAQYLFLRLPAEMTQKLDQATFAILTTLDKPQITPFFKLLLQRGCEPNMQMVINCIRHELTGPFKLLFEEVKETANRLELLLTAINHHSVEIIDLLLKEMKSLSIREAYILTEAVARKDPELAPKFIAAGVNLAQFNYGWHGQVRELPMGTIRYAGYLRYNDFDPSVHANSLLCEYLWVWNWKTVRQILEHPNFNPNLIDEKQLGLHIRTTNDISRNKECLHALQLWRQHPTIRPETCVILDTFIRPLQEKLIRPEMGADLPRLQEDDFISWESPLHLVYPQE